MKKLMLMALIFIGCDNTHTTDNGDDMTIGRAVDATVLGTSGIIEETPMFDNTQRSFNYLDEYVDGNYVYKRAGDNIIIPDFDSESLAYNKNDVVYRDGKINYVSENATGDVALQPEDYTNVDTDIKPSLWGNRYLKVGTLLTDSVFGFKYINIEEEGYIYLFFVDELNVNTEIVKKDVDGDVIYIKTEDECKYLRTDDDGRVIVHISGDCDRYYVLDDVTTDTFVVGTTYTANDGGFKVKGIEEKAVSTVGNGDITDYSYVLVSNVTIHQFSRTALASSSLDVAETKAVVINDDEFVPYTYILKGDDLYLRTSVDAVQQTRTISEVETKVLEHIEEVDWGWAKYRPIAQFAPFDSKKSTVLEANNIVTFTLSSSKMFNMIALNNLYASNVKIETFNSDDTLIDTIESIPKCTATVESEQVSFPVTLPIYFQNVLIGMKIKVTLYPLNGVVKIGEGVLAYKYILGWTDLEFKNSMKDLSPYKEDQWGEIYYEKGIRKRVFNGTATIALDKYDAIGALIYDIAGNKVVIDGNDNILNKETNSNTFFSSANIIGRFQTSEQRTIKVNGRLSDTATYGFTVVEDA